VFYVTVLPTISFYFNRTKDYLAKFSPRESPIKVSDLRLISNILFIIIERLHL